MGFEMCQWFCVTIDATIPRGKLIEEWALISMYIFVQIKFLLFLLLLLFCCCFFVIHHKSSVPNESKLE